MAFPTLQYDATNGSDTNPNGNDGSGTNGDLSSTTLTLNETVDLTGVANDGSDYLWYEGDSGDRHLFQITGFTGGVSTCTALSLATTGTTRTAKNWAVNGERKTFSNDSSRYDYEDYLSGWTVELQDGTYDVPSQIATQGSATQLITYQAASGASPVMRTTADHRHFQWIRYMWAIGITFTTSASPKTNTGICRSDNNAHVFFEDCVFDGLQRLFRSYFYVYGTFKNCVIKNIVSDIILREAYNPRLVYRNCYFFNNGGWQSEGGEDFIDCVIDSCSKGVQLKEDNIVTGNIIDGITNDAIVHTTTNTADVSIVEDNVLSNISGVALKSTGTEKILDHKRNAFYGNGSDYSGVTGSGDDITLTEDPYVDAAGGGFNLNDIAGGGAVLRANNYTMSGLTTAVYPFRNKVSDSFGGGLTIQAATRLLDARREIKNV